MSRVVVIGGGPAGMFAAIAAAENGHHVTLLEKEIKQETPGHIKNVIRNFFYRIV